jgi:hypothetical protein
MGMPQLDGLGGFDPRTGEMGGGMPSPMGGMVQGGAMAKMGGGIGSPLTGGGIGGTMGATPFGMSGGGSRGHDRLGAFTVRNVQPGHPVMRGVPERFEVTDELYYVNAEPEKIPAGTAKITVLAETSPSDKFQKPHPSVWITEHPKARVVGIALGHDQRVHDLKPYQTILTNAAKWASGK